MDTLYYSPLSCALASHILLEEIGVPYAAQRVDFSKNEQNSPAYLALNPKGRVPALKTDRGVITETPAILAYLAARAPQKHLAAIDDPFAFAQAQAFAAYLCATVHVAHAHRPRGSRWADDVAAQEAMKRKVPVNMAACFEIIETKYFKGPWACGETYGFVDPYLFTIAGWLEGDGVDIARFPRVADHYRRVSERPATQRTIAAHTDG